MQLPDPFITPTEEAVITDPFLISSSVVTFQIIGTLPTGEVIAFEIEDPEAVSGWRTMTLAGELAEITPENDQVTFYAPAYVRINKPATAVACGVRSLTDR